LNGSQKVSRSSVVAGRERISAAAIRRIEGVSQCLDSAMRALLRNPLRPGIQPIDNVPPAALLYANGITNPPLKQGWKL